MRGHWFGVLVGLGCASITGGCRAFADRPTYSDWRAYQPLPRSNDAQVELALERLDSLNVFTRRTAVARISELLLGGKPQGYRPSMVVPQVSAAVRERLAPVLTQLVDDVDATVRRRACFALAALGLPYAREAVPALIRASADPDLKVARQAAFALGRLGVSDEEVIEALTEHMVAPPPGLRKRLIELYGPAKAKALRFYAATSLFALLDRSGRTRLPITGKLGRDGTGGDGGQAEPLGQLVPRLAEGVRSHRDWRARRAAALALGELGDKRSYVTVESLRRATRDADPRVAKAARAALQKILRGSDAKREF